MRALASLVLPGHNSQQIGRPDDDLLAIGPVILAVAVVADALAAASFKVDRRRIEEDQVQPAEQITPSREEHFFDSVFRAPRRKRRRTRLLIRR